MSYGFEDMEIKTLQAEVKESSEQIQKLTTDVNAMRKELEISKDELSCTRRALRDKTNEVRDMIKKKNEPQKENNDARSDCKMLKEVAEKVRSKNLELAALVASVQSELAMLSDATMIILDENEEKFTIQTKSGGSTYSFEISIIPY
jgi:chromosome segregation ATPase